MRKIKKLSVVILALIICLQAGLTFPVNAVANVAGGVCGDDVTWSLNENGVMTIEGTGAMATVGYWGHPTWQDYKKQIKEVIIKKGVTTVQNDGFSGCENLTKVTLPATITLIGGGAFRDCKALTSITIPNKVTEIGGYAFRDCHSLTKVTLPDGIKKLGDYCFGYSGIKSIEIPAGVTTLGAYAFENCDNLVTAKIGMGKGSFSLGYRIFADCDNLTTVVNGNAVTGCSNRNNFENCPKLVNVTLGSEMESLYGSFIDCTGLKEITIPDSVTELKRDEWAYGVFQGCTSLEKVTIGTGVTKVDENCFKNCTSLKEIYFCGNSPEFVGTTTMENVTATAYYPKKNNTWKAYNMTNHGTGTINWKQWIVPINHFAPTIKNAKNTTKGITLNWQKMTGATGYNVYRKAGSGKWAKVKTTTSNTWTDTNAKSTNVKYQYKIYAYNKTATSKQSGILTTYYSAATSVTSASNNISKGMLVKWKNNGSTGYKIQYSVNSNFKGSKSTLANKKQSSKQIKKLTKGKTYYVRVATYKTVSGTKYLSQWSAAKKVKISK